MCNAKLRTFWDRNKLFICLLCLFLSFWILIANFFPVAHAAELDGNRVYIDESPEGFVLEANQTVYLYLDENTPLTLEWLQQHKDIGFKVDLNDGSDFFYLVYPKTAVNYVVARHFLKDQIEYYNISSEFYSGSYSLTDPLAFRLDASTSVFCHIIKTITEFQPGVDGSGGADADGKEDPEETIVNPIIDGISDYFDWLFSPILEFIETMTNSFNAIQTFWDSLDVDSLYELEDKLEGITFAPVVDFINSLNLVAITSFMQIWEFDGISHLVIAVVAILLVGGVIKLCMSL